MRRLALLFALPLACGPSLARLERGHHYNEAICGVHERAFPEDQVKTIVRRALDPALHVAVVPRERLAGVLGDGVPELDQVALLRITYDSNTIPLASFDADVALRRGEEIVALTHAELPQFAAVFKENIPGPRTVGPDALDTAAHTVGVIGAAVVTVATLGIFNLLRGVGSAPRSRTEYPTQEEIRAAAPRAAKLHDAVAHLGDDATTYYGGDCTLRPGSRCHTLSLIPRPPTEPDYLALTVYLRYTPACADFSRTNISETVTIPLPPGPTLEARLAAVFGADMRRLSDLTGDARATPPSP